MIENNVVSENSAVSENDVLQFRHRAGRPFVEHAVRVFNNRGPRIPKAYVGYVYLADVGDGIYKIGHTALIEKRMSDLQQLIGQCTILGIEEFITNNRSDAKYLAKQREEELIAKHSDFLHHGREWFAFDEEKLLEALSDFSVVHPEKKDALEKRLN